MRELTSERCRERHSEPHSECSLCRSLPSRAPAEQGTREQGTGNREVTNSPSIPTSLNAGASNSTVDGRLAVDDHEFGQPTDCTHITQLETTTIDDQAKGVRTFICRCGRRGEWILTITPRTEPLATGIIPASVTFERDEPELLIATGRHPSTTARPQNPSSLRGLVRALLVAWAGRRS